MTIRYFKTEPEVLQYILNKEKYDIALSLLSKAMSPKVESSGDIEEIRESARQGDITEAYKIFTDLVA